MSNYDPFKNRHKFQDDIWGPVLMNDLERDVIDTPEFQRLFRTSQMGFVDLVFQTANHTRGAHSIGACHIANKLIDHLNKNTSELYDENDPVRSNLYAFFDISPAERILIRLGALLHDISHLPLSHDIEKKTHKIFYGPPEGEEVTLRSWYGHYNKHDDYYRNPLLYLLVCDHRKSVLANLLRRYSKPFSKQLSDDADQRIHGHIRKFVETINQNGHADWKPAEDLLPQLLFHLLIYEKPADAENPVRTIVTGFEKKDEETESWYLGPRSLTESERQQWHDLWYQPFRHDIIGNTLSADLIDYLTRDPERLGTKLRIDLHLLNYYVLVSDKGKNKTLNHYRCAIDLHDHKRGTTRTFLLNDLFRLLDLRQGIHEKAVMHRVVQSANAMLSRVLLLLEDKKPNPATIVAFNDEKKPHSLQGESLFFRELLNQCEWGSKDGGDASRIHISDAKRLIEKLIDRRVYRPLLIIPGDRAVSHFQLREGGNDGSAVNDSDEFKLRTLAAIVDSEHYSSFLLFVCSCIEKYLGGIFDSVVDLLKYLKENFSDANSQEDFVKGAMAVRPSRVIIWTTPYKQLYKDPAIVVALRDCVGQIDEVYKPLKEKDSTKKRIEKAISDADSKYATLWQLYVFISDGLYYTGTLQKLLNKLPADESGARKRDTHKYRLRSARSLLTVALRVVCYDWFQADRGLTNVQAKEKFLNQRMDVKEFKTSIALWYTHYEQESNFDQKENRRDLAEDVSTVDISQYIHEYPLSYDVDHGEGRPCRDSRYKFDVSAEEEWQKAEAGQTNGSGNELIKFLERCGVADPKMLSRLEFKQLTELYVFTETRERCKVLLEQADSNKSVIPGALKALWLAGYPFPWPKAVEVPKELFPIGDAEIRKWVSDEAKILRPNVKRQLMEDDMDPLIEVLKWASFRNGGPVFEDFRQRLRTEATLMGSDVRVGRLVNALKQRWGDPEIEDLPEGDPEED